LLEHFQKYWSGVHSQQVADHSSFVQAGRLQRLQRPLIIHFEEVGVIVFGQGNLASPQSFLEFQLDEACPAVPRPVQFDFRVAFIEQLKHGFKFLYVHSAVQIK
jgi:hypothetical protein